MWVGSNTVVGFAKGTTWGTAVAVGADEKVLIKSGGPEIDAQDIPNESLTGSRFVSPPDKGDEFHAGDVAFEADYETVHRIMAFAMGQAGSPASAGSGTYTHTLRIPNDVDGIFSTLVIGEASQFVREYPSAKHTGFSLECAHNGRLMGTFGVAGSGLNINTTSGTNELTTLGTIALPTGANANYATFNELDVLINGSGDGALAVGSDDVYPSKVSMTFNPNYKVDDVTTRYAGNIDEPRPDGDAQITGTIEFSKLETPARISDLLNKTTKKMKWIWTTATTLDGSEPGLIELYFSNVVFSTTTAGNIPGKGYVPENVGFTANLATAAHTGFANADAFYAVVQNQQSADPLA